MFGFFSKASELGAGPSNTSRNATPDEDSGSESDGFEETDESRRKLLTDTGAGWKFDSVLDLEPGPESDVTDIVDLISDEGEMSTADNNPSTTSSSKVDASQLVATTAKPRKGQLGLANIVQNEVDLRKREKLGLVGERRLGGVPSGSARSRLLGPVTKPDKPRTTEHIGSGNEQLRSEVPSCNASHSAGGADSSEWACLVCTWYVQSCLL